MFNALGCLFVRLCLAWREVVPPAWEGFVLPAALAEGRPGCFRREDVNDDGCSNEESSISWSWVEEEERFEGFRAARAGIGEKL